MKNKVAWRLSWNKDYHGNLTFNNSLRQSTFIDSSKQITKI
jgi:hypothetical protein